MEYEVYDWGILLFDVAKGKSTRTQVGIMMYQKNNSFSAEEYLKAWGHNVSEMTKVAPSLEA